MSSLSFVFFQTIKNKVKRSLKRPRTFLALVFVVLYAALVLYGLGSMSVDFGLNSPEGIATVLSVLMVMIVPANLISYIKRKDCCSARQKYILYLLHRKNRRKLFFMPE